MAQATEKNYLFGPVLQTLMNQTGERIGMNSVTVTAKKLAEQTSLSPATMSEILNGSALPGHTLEEALDFFEKAIRELRVDSDSFEGKVLSDLLIREKLRAELGDGRAQRYLRRFASRYDGDDELTQRAQRVISGENLGRRTNPS